MLGSLQDAESVVSMVLEPGAYTAIVRGEAPHADSVFELLAASYDKGITDEFVEPTRIGDYQGIKGDFMAEFGTTVLKWEWYGEEVGFGFNFRPDRMRELSAMLIRHPSLPPEVLEFLSDRGKAVTAFQEGWYSTMTEYDPALGLKVAYPKDDVKESFGEVISKAGLTQLRCAETEKYAHVTYFFSGGREAPFEGHLGVRREHIAQRVHHPPALPLHRGDHRGMAVPQHRDAESRSEIHVDVVVCVTHARAAGLGPHDRVVLGS